MCRQECRCVSHIVMLTAFVFFLVAFCTEHWSSSENPDVHSGLFKTCLSASENCFHINVFFNLKSEKGALIAAAVLEIFTLVGLVMTLVLMIFYLCGLFEEIVIGRVAVATAFVAAILGLTGIIIYGVTMVSISYRLDWSFVLAIIGILLDIAGGVTMWIGLEQK